MDYKIEKLDGKFIVYDKKRNYEIDLRDRLFLFAVNTFKFLDTIPYKREYEVFRYQLSKSTTSMGANYEEAQGAFSRREFSSKPRRYYALGIKPTSERADYYSIYVISFRTELYQRGKIGICFKEAKESNYFFRIINALKIGDSDKRINLLNESEQFTPCNN